MIDPRDEVVVSEEELTNDEDEELIDLQKEYDIKRQQLLAKKKKEHTANERFITGVSSSTVVRSINFENRVFEFEVGKKSEQECEDEETFTKHVLRKRYYENDNIKQFLDKHDVKVLTVNKTLAKIIKPEFKEPVYDNWAFIGVVVEKSMLKTQKGDTYVKLRVGTFERTISINLFNGAKDKYHTMIPGELVMMLNPDIHGAGKVFDFFSGEKVNNIISIGLIRDITKCQESGCSKYISTKFEYCDYHESRQEQKFLKNKRMELNGSIKLFNPNHKQTAQAHAERTFNEDSRLYSLESKFDSSKYDEASMFQNKGSKRRIQDERANQQLESKLKRLPSVQFEKIGLVKPRPEEASKAKKRTNLMQEMKSLTKDKKINLTMSKKDKINKLSKWNQNLSQVQIKPKNRTIDPKTQSQIKRNRTLPSTTLTPSSTNQKSPHQSITAKTQGQSPTLTSYKKVTPKPKPKMFEDFELSDDEDLDISFTKQQLDQYKKIKR